MLSIAPLNLGSDAASGTSLSPFDSIDEGLFASFFNQLSDEPESAKEFSQWLMDGEHEELELAELSSDESLEKLVSWLHQRSDDGKALPPGITLEPEIMEKAESLFALLAEYQQEQSVPEVDKAELQYESKADEPLKPLYEIKVDESLTLPHDALPDEPLMLLREARAEQPTETVIETAHMGPNPLEDKAPQGQWTESGKLQTVADRSDGKMQPEVELVKHALSDIVSPQHSAKEEEVGQTQKTSPPEPQLVRMALNEQTAPLVSSTNGVSQVQSTASLDSQLGNYQVKEQVNRQAHAPNEVSQLQRETPSLEEPPAESVKKAAVEIKIGNAALSPQNSSLDGVSLEEAAKLVKQSKEGTTVPSDNVTEYLKPLSKEAQVLVNTNLGELVDEPGYDGSQPEVKASSMLMPPPAKHEQARAMTVPTLEPEKSQPSNLSQIQSLGGQPLQNEKTAEIGVRVFSSLPQESETVVEESEAGGEQSSLKEKTLILKKSAETNNQVFTPKGEISTGQQQALNTSAETAAEAEASDVLAKSSQAGLNVSAPDVAKESLRPLTALSSAERIRAEAEKQSQSFQQSFSKHAEALSESKPEADVKHESVEFEHNSVMRMHRSLGEQAHFTVTNQVPESSTSTLSSPSLHAQPQSVQVAQETSFTQQLTQAQEKLQMLQEKFAPMLGQRLFMMLDQKVQQAEIQLDPPELGSMMVRIQVNQDQQAQVSFVAHNSQAKEALEQAIPRLKDMFQQQEMDLVNAEVSYQQRERGGQQDQQESRQSQFPDTEVNKDSPETLLSSQPQQIILQTGKVDFYA